MNSDELPTITVEHVRLIRGRMALAGLTAPEVAARVRVSPATIRGILSGRYTASAHLGRVLEAVGLPRNMPSEFVAVHLQLMDTLVAAGQADIGALRTALAALSHAANTTNKETRR